MVVAAPLVVPCLRLWLSFHCYQEYLQSVGGQLQRGKLARTGEVPNLQVSPGVALRDGGVGLPVGTNIFCLMLHVSKCTRSHIGHLDGGDIAEEEAQVFNREFFPCCLRSSYLVFMVAACCDHVARWAIGRASYHFPNKIHLPSCYHLSDAGDGVEHPLHFVIA